jgi:hypothetical protein
MDINKLSGSSNVGQRAKAQGAPLAGGAGPSMGGDQLNLSTSKNTLLDEAKAMTPEQASQSISTGGKLIGAGMLGVAAAYWGSAALLGLTGTMLAPVALGVGAAALALWGATKLAKGLGARMNQATEKAFKLPE